MKKLFLLSLVALFTISCSPIVYKATTYSIDYSKYTRDNFFITEAQSVSFEYTPVASVGSIIQTGYLNSKVNGKPELVFATAEDALAYLVVQSQKLGANALIGLKIVNTTATKDFYSSFVASGMAVKR